MAKLKQNSISADIHSNIQKLNAVPVPDNIFYDYDKTFNFIQDNLPRQYAREVVNLLPEAHKVDLNYIRQVKKFRIKNAAIVTALYRVAQFHKLQQS